MDLLTASQRLEAIIADISAATIPIRSNKNYNTNAAFENGLRGRKIELCAAISAVHQAAAGNPTPYADMIQNRLDRIGSTA